MRTPLLALLLVLAVASESCGEPNVFKADVGVKSVNFVIPVNYCKLNDTFPFDEYFINYTKKSHEYKAIVISVFAECERLNFLRKGNKGHLGNNGHIYSTLEQFDDSGVITQDMVNRRISKEIKSYDDSEWKKMVNNAISKATRNSMRISSSVNNMNFGGLIDQDENGIYAMFIGDVSSRTDNFIVFSLVSALVLNNVLIYTTFSRLCDSENAVIELVEFSKNYARQLHSIN